MNYLESSHGAAISQRQIPKLRDGDAEKRGYRHMWRLFASVAHRFNVELVEADIEHWRTILGTTRALDDLVDDDGVSDLRPYLEMLKNGEPIGQIITETEAQDFKTSYEEQSEDRQTHLMGKMV